MADWTKKDPSICCLQETHFIAKNTQTESEGMEKTFHANENYKKAEAAILISEKIE